jgi:hypothetical protein
MQGQDEGNHTDELEEFREFIALASHAPPSIHDSFSQKNLRQTLMAADQRRLPYLANVRWECDGRQMPSLVSFICRDPPPAKVGIIFQQPVMERSAWEFTTPAAAITLDSRGAGRIVTFHFDPHSLTPWDLSDPGTVEPGVVRMALKEAFVPRSIKQEQDARKGNPPTQPPFDLFSPMELSRFIRTYGVVPFTLGVMIYTAKARYVYDIDLLHDTLLQDPRSGHFPLEDRTPRSSRLAHGLDRFVARHEIPPNLCKILEVLFESKGLDPSDVAEMLRIPENTAQSSLETLAGRQLAVWDKKTRLYLPLPHAFLTENEARQERREEEKRLAEAAAQAAAPKPPEEAPEPLPQVQPPPPRPASKSKDVTSDLKKSIDNLLEMVETHPTCPMCGREMDPSSKELVCSDCLKEVSS